MSKSYKKLSVLVDKYKPGIGLYNAVDAQGSYEHDTNIFIENLIQGFYAQTKRTFPHFFSCNDTEVQAQIINDNYVPESVKESFKDSEREGHEIIPQYHFQELASERNITPETLALLINMVVFCGHKAYTTVRQKISEELLIGSINPSTDSDSSLEPLKTKKKKSKKKSKKGKKSKYNEVPITTSDNDDTGMDRDMQDDQHPKQSTSGKSGTQPSQNVDEITLWRSFRIHITSYRNYPFR